VNLTRLHTGAQSIEAVETKKDNTPVVEQVPISLPTQFTSTHLPAVPER